MTVTLEGASFHRLPPMEPMERTLSPEEWMALQSQIYHAISATTWSFSYERDIVQHGHRHYEGSYSDTDESSNETSSVEVSEDGSSSMEGEDY